jgi:hypothetical protein
MNCAICQNEIDMEKSVLTSCDHRFCSTCFFKWLEKKSNCPLCRKVFKEVTSFEIDQEREQLNIIGNEIIAFERFLDDLKEKCYQVEITRTRFRRELSLIKTNIHECNGTMQLLKDKIETTQLINKNINIEVEKKKKIIQQLDFRYIQYMQMVQQKKRRGKLRF